MSFQQRPGVEQQIGKSCCQRRKDDAAQDENIQGFHGSPPVRKQDNGKDVQHAEHQQNGHQRHMNRSPSAESVHGQTVPEVLLVRKTIGILADGLLFFHVHLFTDFPDQVLSHMSAGRYHHHECRCRPRQERI